MAKYQIIYWRDMPAQIKIRQGRKKLSRPLAPRFMIAIDAVAMQEGTTDTDSYLEEWRSGGWQERDGDSLAAIANELVTEVEAAYPAKKISQLAKQGGKEISDD